jgi:hypothetical protein
MDTVAIVETWYGIGMQVCKLSEFGQQPSLCAPSPSQHLLCLPKGPSVSTVGAGIVNEPLRWQELCADTLHTPSNAMHNGSSTLVLNKQPHTLNLGMTALHLRRKLKRPTTH